MKGGAVQCNRNAKVLDLAQRNIVGIPITYGELSPQLSMPKEMQDTVVHS